MTSKIENPLCTCPSGDGSLQHPCPMHPTSNESDLKVGDTVSYTPLFSKSTYCMAKVMNEVHLAYLKDLVKKGCTLYRGIHPSLLPEGYALVEKKTFDDLIAGAASDSIVIRCQVGEIEALQSNLQIMQFAFDSKSREVKVEYDRNLGLSAKIAELKGQISLKDDGLKAAQKEIDELKVYIDACLNAPNPEDN